MTQHLIQNLPFLMLIAIVLWLIFEQYKMSRELKSTKARLEQAESWIRATADWLTDNWRQTHADQPQDKGEQGAEAVEGSTGDAEPLPVSTDDPSDIHDVPPATPVEQKPSPWGQALPIQPDVWHGPETAPDEVPEDTPQRPAAPPIGTPWDEPERKQGPTLAQRFKALTARDWMLGFGAIALALAGVYLVQYSIQNQLLGPLGRCLLALSFGLGLVGTSLVPRFRDKQPALAEVMAGAGVLTLYGAGFAAHVLYQLISAPIAFLAIIATTAGGIGLSLLMGRRIAWLALAGGYLVPILLNSPTPAIWPVMIYVSALTAAMLWLARDRGWVELLPLSAAGLFGWQGLTLLAPLTEGEASWSRMLPVVLSSALIVPIWRVLHHSRKAWPERLKGAHVGALFIGFFGLLIALMALQRLDFSAPGLIWLTAVSAAWLYGLRLFPKALNPGAFGTASVWLVAIFAWDLGQDRAVLAFDHAAAWLIIALPVLLRLTSRGEDWARPWRMLSMLYVPIAVVLSTVTGGWLISAGLTMQEQVIGTVMMLALTLLHLPVPRLRDEDLADDKALRNLYRLMATFWPLMPAAWLMFLFVSGEARWPLHVAAFALPALMAVLTRKRADKTLHALIAAGAVLLPSALAPIFWNGQTALADLSLWGLLLTPAVMALAARRGWVPPVLDGLAPFAVILGYSFARFTGWPFNFDVGFAVVLEGVVLVTSTFVLMRGMALKSEEARSILLGFAGLAALLSMLVGEYPPVPMLGLITIMLGLYGWFARAGRLPVGPLGLGLAGFMIIWMLIDMGSLTTLPGNFAVTAAAVPFVAGFTLTGLWTAFCLYRLGWEANAQAKGEHGTPQGDEHWAVAATVPPLVVLWGAWASDILFEGVTPWVLCGFALLLGLVITLLRRVPPGSRDVYEDQAISVLAAGAVIAFIFCGYALGTGRMLSITFAAAGALALIGYGALRIRRLDFWAGALAFGAFIVGFAQLGPIMRLNGIDSLIPATVIQHAALPLVLFALGLFLTHRMGRGRDAIPLWLSRVSVPLAGLIIIAAGRELNGPLLAADFGGWSGWGLGMVGLGLAALTYAAHLLLARSSASPMRGAVLSLGLISAVWVLCIQLGLRNPAFHQIEVGSLPVLNATALLALLPALLAAALARSLINNRGEEAWTTRATATGATLIGAIWVAMAVRQGFQGSILFGPQPGTAESLITCLGLTAYAALLLGVGIWSRVKLWRQLGLSTLLATFALVSWLAWSRLEGLASAGAFIGLAVVLLGGYAIYDKLDRHLSGDGDHPDQTAA